MPISSLLLGLTLAVLVLPFVLEPFVRHDQSKAVPVSAGDSSALTKEAALVAVRDLDFDFQTGKVTEADYVPLRQQLLAAAAEAAQRERPARQRPRRVADARTDGDIEAAVRSLRREAPAAGWGCPACGTAATAGDKFCGRCGAALEQTCPSCQAAVRAGDRFCAICGAALNPKVEQVS